MVENDRNFLSADLVWDICKVFDWPCDTPLLLVHLPSFHDPWMEPEIREKENEKLKSYDLCWNQILKKKNTWEYK